LTALVGWMAWVVQMRQREFDRDQFFHSVRQDCSSGAVSQDARRGLGATSQHSPFYVPRCCPQWSAIQPACLFVGEIRRPAP
jgi:hypothetical protein